MTTAARNIQDAHLAAQLGENGVFTEQAIFDPTGVAVILYGWFDDTVLAENKDSGNVKQKNIKRRFVLSAVPAFDVYDKKILTLVESGESYTIEYVDKDEHGPQVLWLV